MIIKIIINSIIEIKYIIKKSNINNMFKILKIIKK